MKNQDIINDLYIQVAIISPVEKIIIMLESGNIRDCDIKWLDSQLEKYMIFAAKTLGLNNQIVPSQVLSEKYKVMNEFVTSHYLEKFKALLSYFKSF